MRSAKPMRPVLREYAADTMRFGLFQAVRCDGAQGARSAGRGFAGFLASAAPKAPLPIVFASLGRGLRSSHAGNRGQVAKMPTRGGRAKRPREAVRHWLTVGEGASATALAARLFRPGQYFKPLLPIAPRCSPHPRVCLDATMPGAPRRRIGEAPLLCLQPEGASAAPSRDGVLEPLGPLIWHVEGAYGRCCCPLLSAGCCAWLPRPPWGMPALCVPTRRSWLAWPLARGSDWPACPRHPAGLLKPRWCGHNPLKGAQPQEGSVGSASGASLRRALGQAGQSKLPLSKPAGNVTARADGSSGRKVGGSDTLS